MSERTHELGDSAGKKIFKVIIYALGYVISFAASVFGAALMTGLVYQLTYYGSQNDDISFFTFLIAVPVGFIILSWLVVPRVAKLIVR